MSEELHQEELLRGEREVLMLAEIAGISIDPAHIPGVVRNLAVLRQQAALLMDAAMPAVTEPAPVFHP